MKMQKIKVDEHKQLQEIMEKISACIPVECAFVAGISIGNCFYTVGNTDAEGVKEFIECFKEDVASIENNTVPTTKKQKLQ